MPIKTLPSSPSLDHLKHQARDLQKALQAHEQQALQRVREFHPRARRMADAEISATHWSLSDVQLVIAREYCRPNWANLKAFVQNGVPEHSHVPMHERISDPTFRRAVDLLDAGDETGLRRHLAEHPEVVRQRVFFNIGAYFGQPTLLEFAAENPIRRRTLPGNIVQVAKVVLDAGAKDDKGAIQRTLELVCSGLVPRECGVQIDLIDLLCEYGADPGSAVGAALVHGEFAAVDALIRHGLKVDLSAAAALGRIDEVRALLSKASGDERHKALALASQFGRLEIVRILLDAGEDPNRFNPIGCHSHSTPLHQAALSGNLDMVCLLVERGADPNVKDILYGGTPAGWAEYAGKQEIKAFLERSSGD
jgi:hypothetical protein